MKKDCDIIVSGGGLVGSTLAGLLADSGLRIVILESNPPPDAVDASKDIRVSALTLVTKNIFKSIGAWQFIANKDLAPIMEMHIWDAGSNGQIHFDCAEIGEPCLGYIAGNQLILDTLQSQVKRNSNVKIKFGTRLQDFRISRDEIVVATEDGETISANLLIGADGANSRVRSIAGIANHGWQYQQTAIVATVDTEKRHNSTAWQRFLPTGPLAFLPLADPHQTSIVWSADTACANKLLKLNDQDFKESLGEHFEYRLGEIKKTGPRNGFALTYGHAEAYIDERLALIGDAAHRMHPLAGQGVNMGLLDAAVLAEVIQQNFKQGRDTGRACYLKTYARWRKQDNQFMLTATDGFKRVFGVNQPFLNYMRGMAMNLVSGLPPMRHRMMCLASGLTGNLPQAARPYRPAQW